MIKDRLFKSLFIPAIGLLIPLGAGLVDWSRLSVQQIIFSAVFFIFTTHVTWLGSVNIISYLRSRKCFRNNISQKLSILLLVTVLYGVTTVLVTAGFWQFFILKSIVIAPLIKAAAITAVVVLMLTLVYESVFLSAEIDLDERVMLQLEQERLQAQTSVLQNELDPHFLFNSLNALSYLVQHDQKKAYEFVHKLSNVFKYLLLNKQKDFVSLDEEICFLEDYYFLLRVRFDDSIQINNTIDADEIKAQLLPCTLQALVENAIKHNFFSDNEPLIISIQMNNHFITVANSIRPKLYKPNSTKTGLDNLRSRYKLVMNKNIIVQRIDDQFLVKIPIDKKAA
jgi:two-component system, LytTR family, sensor kinase